MSIAAPIGIFVPTRVRRPTGTTPVTVYATWWSVPAYRIHRALARADVAHQYFDVEVNPDAKWTLRSIAHTDTLELPVVYIDGEWLSVPTLEEVKTALHRHGLLDPPHCPAVKAETRGEG